MTAHFKNISALHFFTIPLILGSFAAGLFFRGTDNILVLPHIAAIIAFAGITLWPRLQKNRSLPGGLVVITLLLYWGYVCITPLWSSVPYNSILFMLIFSVLPFTFFTLVLNPQPLENLKTHLGALALGTALLSLWALIQFFILDVGQRVHHPMLNPNNLAVIFNMALFPALALYFYSQHKLHTILGFTLALLYLLALLTTQSRGGLLSFLIAAGPFLFFARSKTGFTIKKLLLFAAAAACAFLLINFVTSGRMGTDFTSVLALGESEIETVTERKLIWQATGQIIRDHFWLGTGLGSFTYFYPRYRLPGDFSDGYFVHMDPLQFWAEMGILAPVLFYAVLVAVFLRTLRATQASSPSSPERIWIYGFFCGLLALAGHAHISFHLYMPVNLFLAAFLLAGWYIATERALNSPRREIAIQSPIAKPALRITFILLLLIPLIWLSQAMAGVYYIKKAGEFLQNGEIEQTRTAIDKARLYAPKSYGALYDYEARYSLQKLADKTASYTPEERTALYRQAHEYIDRAITLNTGFANLWSRKAMIYFAGNKTLDPHGLEKAQDLLNKTLKANPLLLDARFQLVRLYASNGENEKALQIMTEGEKHPLPRSIATIEFYNQLARMAFKTGNLDKYNNTIQKRNKFAKRYGLKILQPTPLSQEDIEQARALQKERP